MAPGRIDNEWYEPTPADKSIFPDGYKTAGQQEPVYSHIVPFDKFPKEIKGVTVWKPEDFKNNPEKWTHAFTDDEMAEIGAAADKYIESELPLTAIAKVCHALISFSQ
jgi:hypothetical protein